MNDDLLVFHVRFIPNFICVSGTQKPTVNFFYSIHMHFSRKMLYLRTSLREGVFTFIFYYLLEFGYRCASFLNL